MLIWWQWETLPYMVVCSIDNKYRNLNYMCSYSIQGTLYKDMFHQTLCTLVWGINLMWWRWQYYVTPHWMVMKIVHKSYNDFGLGCSRVRVTIRNKVIHRVAVLWMWLLPPHCLAWSLALPDSHHDHILPVTLCNTHTQSPDLQQALNQHCSHLSTPLSI